MLRDMQIKCKRTHFPPCFTASPGTSEPRPLPGCGPHLPASRLRNWGVLKNKSTTAHPTSSNATRKRVRSQVGAALCLFPTGRNKAPINTLTGVRERIQRETLGLRWRFPVVASASQSRGCSCPLSSARKGTGKMVNVLKGVLVECDPAMKQFLLYLDESNALGKKFIIQDLDETHVFVLAELVNFLQERVGELMDQNSFPITQK
uniref:General transcription factor IIH subunit 5 n=1 Tax=Cyanistes caeruleus TaxID=156563 RepID=A0A8C0UZ94_CYACU